MVREPILIVDDSPANLKLARVVLQAAGYEVRVATDADQALRVLETWHPRLILMDIQLPGMDGLTLTRRLKDSRETGDIVVIALTAYAMKGDEERARAAGCDGYVSKPIDTDALPRIVAEHLAQAVPHPTEREPPVILVVDDNATTRKVLRLTLEGEGYRAVEAANATLALAWLAQGMPALALVDSDPPRPRRPRAGPPAARAARRRRSPRRGHQRLPPPRRRHAHAARGVRRRGGEARRAAPAHRGRAKLRPPGGRRGPAARARQARPRRRRRSRAAQADRRAPPHRRLPRVHREGRRRRAGAGASDPPRPHPQRRPDAGARRLRALHRRPRRPAPRPHTGGAGVGLLPRGGRRRAGAAGGRQRARRAERRRPGPRRRRRGPARSRPAALVAGASPGRLGGSPSADCAAARAAGGRQRDPAPSLHPPGGAALHPGGHRRRAGEELRRRARHRRHPRRLPGRRGHLQGRAVPEGRERPALPVPDRRLLGRGAAPARDGPGARAPARPGDGVGDGGHPRRVGVRGRGRFGGSPAWASGAPCSSR